MNDEVKIIASVMILIIALSAIIAAAHVAVRVAAFSAGYEQMCVPGRADPIWVRGEKAVTP